ncbi:MAG TPA: hypothetical protein VFC47_15390 [Caulobacteraceae bacterium]|nr:hypothetical protein [Caulobacteraceae bacterium]
MTAALALLAVPGLAAAAEACAAPPPASILPADMLARVRRGGPFPSFCSIPVVPKDVPTAAFTKSEVQDIRLDGRQLARRTGPETFSLSGTAALTDQLRRQAAPPPPMTPPSEADTAAFVAAMKAKAAPPPRKH